MTFQPDDFRDDPDFDTPALTEAAALRVAAPDPEALARAATRRLIAQRRLAVRSIHVDYAPQMELEDALDEALESAPLLRDAELPQPAVHLLADSFSGKSAAARQWIAKVLARGDQVPGTTPVAYGHIDTDGTIGSVATDILKALGEKRPDALTPDKRWDRARQAIRAHGLKVLVFDEFQRAGRRPTISPAIAGKILDIMDSGDCAVAFIGKKDAVNVFKSCQDLMNRLDTPVHIPRLMWTTDQEDFTKFADAFDQALVDARITKVKSGLADPDTAQRLLEASNGLIGQFSRIVETAVVMMTRDGADAITRQDLRDAVQEWSIGNGRIGHNPFVKSLADIAAETGAGKTKTGKARGVGKGEKRTTGAGDGEDGR